jgi:hypothetical protein
MTSRYRLKSRVTVRGRGVRPKIELGAGTMVRLAVAKGRGVALAEETIGRTFKTFVSESDRAIWLGQNAEPVD